MNDAVESRMRHEHVPRILAGCDVFALTSRNEGMANVMLAPHNSNSSPKAWDRVHENTIANLFEVLEGEA